VSGIHQDNSDIWICLVWREFELAGASVGLQESLQTIFVGFENHAKERLRNRSASETFKRNNKQDESKTMFWEWIHSVFSDRLLWVITSR
jgi:hypothetical protein